MLTIYGSLLQQQSVITIARMVICLITHTQKTKTDGVQQHCLLFLFYLLRGCANDSKHFTII